MRESQALSDAKSHLRSREEELDRCRTELQRVSEELHGVKQQLQKALHDETVSTWHNGRCG